MRNKKIAIFGSGPSGLITAYLLSQKNYKVDVFEASAKVGGLAQSIELWGQKVEIGPHFLNYDDCKPIKALVTELFDEKEILKFERNTNIFIKNNHTFSYPPTFKTLVCGLSTTQFFKSLMSFLSAGIKKSGIYQNAEKAMVATMGKYLYQLFFKEYSEKLWCIPCNELDVCYCRALLPLKKGNVLSNLFNFTKAASKYVYFENGISELWDRIYTKCIQNNVTFHLNLPVIKCETVGNEIKIYGQNNYAKKYDYVISSLSNNLNRQFFGLSQTQKYSFRNVILVYLKTGQTNIISGQCLYIYSKEVNAVRITDFSNFPHKNTVVNILLVEYWVGSSGLWEESDTAIINNVRNDLKKLDITVSFKEFCIKKMSNVYRVPEYGLPEKLIKESSDLQSPNFFSLGRSNSPYFNYGMDTAITEAVNFCNRW